MQHFEFFVVNFAQKKLHQTKVSLQDCSVYVKLYAYKRLGVVSWILYILHVFKQNFKDINTPFIIVVHDDLIASYIRLAQFVMFS